MTASSRVLIEIDKLIRIFTKCGSIGDVKTYQIYFFKQESIEYAKIFENNNDNINKVCTYFVPVFEFEYITNQLSMIINNEILLSSYSGIVMTSPRSVYALQATLKENNINPLNYRLSIPIFTFGAKTPKLMNKLFPNLKCIVFEKANDSNSMSLLLINHLKQNNNNDDIPSLLILFGQKHRTELTTNLNKNNINFKEIIVYKTIDLNELKYIKDIDYINNHCFWIFFSPNGIDIVMRYLQRNNDKLNINEMKKEIKCGSLGQTTANKLREINWNPSFIAKKPNANSLYDAWYHYISNK